MNLVLSNGQAMNFGSNGMSGNVLEYFTVQTRSRTDSLLKLVRLHNFGLQSDYSSYMEGGGITQATKTSLTQTELQMNSS